MKLVFAGTPDFAVPTLAALLGARHDVALVLTQPDRPAGRGRNLAASPVKQFALARGLAVAHYLEPLAAVRPDAMIVVAYGLLLPQTVLSLPRFGCINVHASLLPRWRGAAPIARAIDAGDTTTGVTIMQMDCGLDTGPMLLRTEVPIVEGDTAATLHDKLAHVGADALIAALRDIETGRIEARAQDEGGATYARKLSKEEGRIDWRQAAVQIANRVRAFNPWPVAYAVLDDAPVRFWNARHLAEPTDQPPGTVVRADSRGVAVATGEGVLVVNELQAAGGKRLPAGAFLNGRALRAGDKFD